MIYGFGRCPSCKRAGRYLGAAKVIVRQASHVFEEHFRDVVCRGCGHRGPVYITRFADVHPGRGVISHGRCSGPSTSS